MVCGVVRLVSARVERIICLNGSRDGLQSPAELGRDLDEGALRVAVRLDELLKPPEARSDVVQLAHGKPAASSGGNNKKGWDARGAELDNPET